MRHAIFPPRLALGLLALSLAVASSAFADGGISVQPSVAAKVAKANAKGLTPLSLAKMSSGVQLAYRIDGTPAVGRPLRIVVQLSSRANAQVTLAADAGLGLQAPKQVLSVAAGDSTEQVLTVVPQAEGRFHLNLLASSEGRGGATGFAVQVGKGMPVLKPAGKVMVTPSGERLVSIPVR